MIISSPVGMFREIIYVHFLAIVITRVSSSTVNYTLCDDTSAYKITAIRINCIGWACSLIRGHNYTIEIDFTTPNVSAYLPYAASIVNDQMNSLEISTGDAYKNLTFRNSSLTFTFKNVLTIPLDFPQSKTEVFFFMWDDELKLAMCFKVDVEIKDSFSRKSKKHVTSLMFLRNNKLNIVSAFVKSKLTLMFSNYFSNP